MLLVWLFFEGWLGHAFGPLAATGAGLAAVVVLALLGGSDPEGYPGSRILGWVALALPVSWWAAGFLLEPLGWPVLAAALFLAPTAVLAVVLPVELLLGRAVAEGAAVVGALAGLTWVVAACLLFGAVPVVLASAFGLLAAVGWGRVQRVRWGSALAERELLTGTIYLSATLLAISGAVLGAPGVAALLGWATPLTGLLLVVLGCVLVYPVARLGERVAGG
ncbi:purine-cytosine permease-like protein [Crossiella equi]|uniref:Purine-cytosine permease-like protein n=1 Tax=Crossiella equi TaxID=130796 RepID=A0ABS5A4T3_9PSEU|nr:hypothetical protein [Crossiella equi]MBP2471297.1 purine-cytosine permease-like protein [Crossiella equi]